MEFSSSKRFRGWGPSCPVRAIVPAPRWRLRSGRCEFWVSNRQEVSRIEIGQSVVVKQGTVLAVEGFEGTDACLQRGGELAGRKGGAVGIKVAKAQHDMRFDIPCMSLTTIEHCLSCGFRALTLNQERSFYLKRTVCEARLSREPFTLLAVPAAAASADALYLSRRHRGHPIGEHSCLDSEDPGAQKPDYCHH